MEHLARGSRGRRLRTRRASASSRDRRLERRAARTERRTATRRGGRAPDQLASRRDRWMLGVGAACRREHLGARGPVPADQGVLRAARRDDPSQQLFVTGQRVRRRRPAVARSSPRRSSAPAARGCDRAAASARRCVSSRSTPTPPTSSRPIQELRSKLDILRGHCDDVGRDSRIPSGCRHAGRPARRPRRAARARGAVRRHRDRARSWVGPDPRRPGRLDRAGDARSSCPAWSGRRRDAQPVAAAPLRARLGRSVRPHHVPHLLEPEAGKEPEHQHGHRAAAVTGTWRC